MYRIIFVAVLVLNFVYSLTLYALSASQKKKPLPQNVRDVYDSAEYERWSRYSAEKARLGIFEKVFDFAVMLVMFLTNVFAWVYDLLPGGEYSKSILLLIIYMFVLTVVSIPFDYVRVMKIEEKYGFNKTTKKTFVLDQIKNFIVNTGLNVGLLCIVLALWNALGVWFFIAAYAVIALFVIVFSMLSMTFMKLFNKFTPLPEGELRDTLTELFRKSGYELSDIYVMDASSRTTKVNAYCTGLGRFKKIVLYDNLVNGYSTGEIAAVFSHELAHYKHKDTAKNTLYSLLMMLVVTVFLAAFVLVPEISIEFGFAAESVVFGMIVFTGFIGDMVMTILMIPSAFLSRKYEYRADRAAAEAGYAEEMITALKKLSKDNFADLNPHPIEVALEHSHPTVSMRAAALEGYSEK
ncbi:MAG: M48 family metallopeptidase [Ruminococcaceae bacterium]|nr:M48 family metallopeptidase [Oscillospiraceae bacterium]